MGGTKEQHNAATRRYREKHPDRVKENSRMYALLNRDKLNSYARIYAKRKRLEVLAAYGGKCACCGEAQEEFLTIDHINNDGEKHRKEIFGTHASGGRMYAWLRSNGFPQGFQVLCWNCNMAKGYYGTCPHQNTPE